MPRHDTRQDAVRPLQEFQNEEHIYHATGTAESSCSQSSERMIQSRMFFLLGHFIFYLCGFSVLSPCAMCRKLARPPSRCGQEKSLYVVLSVHVKIVFAIAIYFAQLSVLRNNSRLVKCIEFLQPEKFRLSRNLAAERHGNEITIFETCRFFDDYNKRSSGE